MAFAPGGGATNTYLPALQDNLYTSWSRNAKSFAVNMICRYRPIKKPTGQYLYFNPLDYQRFPNGVPGTPAAAASNPYLWAPGDLRPMQGGPALGFEFRPYNCKRYSPSVQLDLLADQVADFPFLKNETENLAAKAMASRAIEVVGVLTTSGNYPSANVDTATNWGGGYFNAGTETNPIIKTALMKASVLLNRVTNGNVSTDNLVLIVNPNSAYKMGLSQEVHTIFVRSQFAGKLITSETGLGSNAGKFGLPEQLYSVRVVVMDATVNLYNQGASGEAREYIFPDNTAVLACVNSNGGDASEAGSSYETCQIFIYEDMKVETETDTWNRIIKASVTDNRQAVQVSGTSGVLITNLFS